MNEQVPSEKRFDRVHAVCVRLRNKPCELCPSRYKDDRYGWVVKGCYALAQETCNIAVNGHPWSKKAKGRFVRAWRRRFNRE